MTFFAFIAWEVELGSYFLDVIVWDILFDWDFVGDFTKLFAKFVNYWTVVESNKVCYPHI
jgi:hypothetical protein